MKRSFPVRSPLAKLVAVWGVALGGALGVSTSVLEPVSAQDVGLRGARVGYSESGTPGTLGPGALAFESPDEGSTANAAPLETEFDAIPLAENPPVPERDDDAARPRGPFAALVETLRKREGWTFSTVPKGAGSPFGGLFGAAASGGGGAFAVELEFGANAGVGDEFPLASESANDERQTISEPYFSRWARFAPGSWARYRTTGVAYEGGRASQSVVETLVRLKETDVAAGRYSLECETTIKMGGADYSRESQTAAFDFWDVPSDGATVEDLPPVSLMIAGKAIPCRTRRSTRATSRFRETTTVWYSPVVAPYVLQTETVREPLSNATSTGANAASTASANADATSVGFGDVDSSAETAPIFRKLTVAQKTAAHLLLGGNLAEYAVCSSTRKGRRVESSSTVYATALPGGVVRESTVETDAAGAVLYRSSTVLLDYYVAY